MLTSLAGLYALNFLLLIPTKNCFFITITSRNFIKLFSIYFRYNFRLMNFEKFTITSQLDYDGLFHLVISTIKSIYSFIFKCFFFSRLFFVLFKNSFNFCLHFIRMHEIFETVSEKYVCYAKDISSNFCACIN